MDVLGRALPWLLVGALGTVPFAVRDAQDRSVVGNVADLEPYRRWVAVEIADAATGEPLPRYAEADCQRILTDGVRLPVTWQEQRTLAGVEVERNQLRFRLYGRTKLYSFAFVPATDISPRRRGVRRFARPLEPAEFQQPRHGKDL